MKLHGAVAVVTGGGSGRDGHRLGAFYSAAKAGVVSLSESLTAELATCGIGVTVDGRRARRQRREGRHWR